jgi:hypothetical protein
MCAMLGLLVSSKRETCPLLVVVTTTSIDLATAYWAV